MKYICTACQEPMDWEEFNSHSCPRLTKPQEEKMSVTPEVPAPTPLIRKFETGATRDTDQNKLDYEAFFSPAVLKRRAQFMHKHRVQPDGTLRDGDNWKKGIPQRQYMKSLMRHIWDVWAENQGIATSEGLEEAICAAMFNLEGMLYEILKRKETK